MANEKATNRWGIWCEPTPERVAHLHAAPGVTRWLGDDAGRWATGPDGVLVLYETVAKHLAAHFDDILTGQFRHEARRFPETIDAALSPAKEGG